MNSNVFPFTPASFSSVPLGSAVVTFYDRDRGRPIYITAVAHARRWLEAFYHNIVTSTSGLRYHVARNLSDISFGVEEARDFLAVSAKARSAIAASLPWFNFPRELRELAGYTVPEPKNREAMLSYAREHCLPVTVRLLERLMDQAGQPLNLRKLFRASNSSTMETFVAAWDELVEEGLVEGWERRKK